MDHVRKYNSEVRAMMKAAQEKLFGKEKCLPQK